MLRSFNTTTMQSTLTVKLQDTKVSLVTTETEQSKKIGLVTETTTNTLTLSSSSVFNHRVTLDNTRTTSVKVLDEVKFRSKL